MKKLLSVLLSFCIIFSSISVVYALDVELPKSLDAFTEDVSALINEYEELSSESAVYFTVADDENEEQNTEGTNRLIVKSSRKIDTLNAINSVSGYNNLYILQFENSEDCDAALEHYSTLSYVQYVQEDGILEETAIEETEAPFNEAAIGTSSQYQSDIFGYTNAKANMGSAEVTIAVVDTGVANDHEYLAGRVIPTGFDSVYNESCYDKRGHGTHVAGIIVANTKSNVKIKPYKVIGDDGTGTDTQLYLGIQAAIEDGVDIINLSLTRKGESEVVHEAVQNAYNAGITVVAAAGNDNANLNETFYTPACFDEVICVVNIDANKKRASTSNWRFNDTLSAPGVDILSSYVNNTYKIMSGTSMAAPFISCCVAYLLASGDYYSPEEAYNTLFANTQQGATKNIHYVVPGELINSKNTCATPVFTYSSGEFAGYLDVGITCSTPGATVMYRTSDMSSDTYYEYTGPIRIEKNASFSAYAFCPNYKVSSSASVDYTKVNIDTSVFNIDENGTLIGYTGTDTVVEVPDFVNGKCVSSVSSTAFGGNTALTKVSFGQYLTTIGGGAFKNCTALTTVYASSCIDVEAEAFKGCTSLKTLSITSVVTIGNKAFSGCSSLTSVSLNKLILIGDNAFENTGLTTFRASKLTNIGDSAFYGSALKTVSLSKVTEIGANAFAYCGNLTSVTFTSATSVGKYCFSGCENLTSATISKISVISEGVFKNCKGLTNVGASSASIVEAYAFYGCSGITSFDFTKITSIGDYAFAETGIESIVLPNTVTELGEKSFYNCSAVKSIELTSFDVFDTLDFLGMPNVETLDVPKVTEFAFNGGSFSAVFPKLKTFNNANGIKELTSSFFDGCSELESITFTNVTKIGDNAFKGTALKEANFSNVTDIGKSCFSDMPTLETVVLSSLNHIDFSVFSGSENVKFINLHNLKELPTDFRCVEIFPHIQHFDSGCVTDIPEYAFKDCSELTYYNFVYAVTIGDEAFSGTAISNPECPRVTKLGSGAFKNCTNLGIVKFPVLEYINLSVFENSEASVTELDLRRVLRVYEEAVNFDFSEFINLKSVNLYMQPVIPARSFKGCSALEEINLASCTKICEEAFAYCASLVEVKVNMATTIEKNAFQYCTGLQIFEANNVTTFDFTTFDGCSNLKSLSFNSLLEIPVDEDGKINVKGIDNLESFSANNLAVIPNNFLKDCTKLTTVSFASASEVGDYAFYNTAITAIDFPLVTSVGEYAFASCSELASVILTKVEKLPLTALSGSHNITSLYIDSITELPVSDEGLSYVSDKMLLTVFSCDSVTEIPDDYFVNNKNLESVSILKAKVIGNRAFMDVPVDGDFWVEELEVVGEYAFYGSKIDKLMCDTIVEIGDHAFQYSSIGRAGSDSLSKIGEYAFADCEKLSYVYALGETLQIGVGAFENNAKMTSFSAYAEFAVSDKCFKNCNKLNQIISTTSPRNNRIAYITHIGNEAFSGCTSLKAEYFDFSKIQHMGTDCINGVKFTAIPMNMSDLVCADEGAFNGFNCSSLALENAEVIKDLPECEYVVIGSDIKEFSCESTDTIICAYEDSVVDEFCTANGLNFKKYDGKENIFYDVDSVLTGYDYVLSFEAMGFNTTYEWYACNNPDRSDGVYIGNTYNDPQLNDPITIFFDNCEENKYTYFYCIATSTENGNVIEIESRLCKNLFATIKGTDNTFIDFYNELIYTDSIYNINTLDNIFTVNGDIRVTPSYSTDTETCYGSGTVVEILNGDEVALTQTIVVYGDINGDGIVDVLDVSKIEKEANGNSTGFTEKHFEMAADTDDSGSIDVADYQSAVNKALAS